MYPLVGAVGVYSAVLLVFHVSSCCCDLLCVVLLPKSAEELCVVSVHSSHGGRCVYGLVLKHSLVFAEITVLYTHEMELYFKHIITCNATKFYTDNIGVQKLFCFSHNPMIIVSLAPRGQNFMSLESYMVVFTEDHS